MSNDRKRNDSRAPYFRWRDCGSTCVWMLWFILAAQWIAETPAWGASEEVLACATSYEEAQLERRESRLRSARAHLRVCSHSRCPGFIRSDCEQWMSEVMRALPSVLFSALDDKGEVLEQVAISVDGMLLPSHTIGGPIELDPGEHRVVFKSELGTVEKTIVLRQAEKHRVVSAVFQTQSIRTQTDDESEGNSNACPSAGCGARSSAGRSQPTEGRVPAPADLGSIPAAMWWAGSVGVLGAATFTVSGLMARKTAQQGRAECDNAGCVESRLDKYVDRERRQILVANTGLAVGAAGFLTAAVLAFVFDDAEVKEEATAARVALTVRRGGGVLSWQQAF